MILFFLRFESTPCFMNKIKLQSSMNEKKGPNNRSTKENETLILCTTVTLVFLIDGPPIYKFQEKFPSHAAY